MTFEEAIETMEEVAGKESTRVWFDKAVFISMINSLRYKYAPEELDTLSFKINKAMDTNEYTNLTKEEEDEIISCYPNQFSRDEKIVLNGKVVYDGLLGGDDKCNHLVKTLSSGVKCVKCGAWYCA